MKATGNRKRSVVIMNKRTSVCLEERFWLSLHAIVQMEQTTIEAFIEGVKHEHDPRNLSSSLRVAILEYFQLIAAKDSNTRDEMMQVHAACEIPEALQQTSRERREKVVAFWSGVQRDEMAVAK